MKICVIGTGYVGLVTGTCLANVLHTVTCIDKDTDKIALLNSGKSPIYERGLETLIRRNMKEQRLFFTTDYSAIADAEAVFIAVGTPASLDMTPDLSVLMEALDSCAEQIRKFTVVIVKSTVPVGTCVKVSRRLSQKLPAEHFAVASNPEFLREGKAVDDFMYPSRIVVGTMEPKAHAVMEEIYKPFIDKGDVFVDTDLGNAELIKYAANAFLALKVAFINEIADLCEALSLDVEKVATGVGLDPRIGKKFLRAGPGYGGSCFPKDTHGLYSIAKQHNTPMPILNSAISSNDVRKRNLLQRVKSVIGDELSSKVISVLGVTFKAGTDDIRGSPSLELLPALHNAGAVVKVYDPQYADSEEFPFDNCEQCDNPYAAAENADLLIIHTEWKEFLELDWEKIKRRMNTPVIYDFRNMFPLERMQQLGFVYHSIGRR